MKWTFEQDRMLLTMWNKGLTAKQIAEALGRTRNSIIGRAHRIGAPVKVKEETNVESNEPFLRKRGKYTHTFLRMGDLKDQKKLAKEILPEKLTHFFDLNHKKQCQYMPGDDRMCCGKPVKQGSAYCEGHAELFSFESNAKVTDWVGRVR